MQLIRPTRRATLLGLAAIAAASATPLRAQAVAGAIEVLKDPGCSCCEAWADTPRAAGFAVTVEEAPNDSARRHGARDVELSSERHELRTLRGCGHARGSLRGSGG